MMKSKVLFMGLESQNDVLDNEKTNSQNEDLYEEENANVE
jgi:hypothetical protein